MFRDGRMGFYVYISTRMKFRNKRSFGMVCRHIPAHFEHSVLVSSIITAAWLRTDWRCGSYIDGIRVVERCISGDCFALLQFFFAQVLLIPSCFFLVCCSSPNFLSSILFFRLSLFPTVCMPTECACCSLLQALYHPALRIPASLTWTAVAAATRPMTSWRRVCSLPQVSVAFRSIW
jgi:hypothetical protein